MKQLIANGQENHYSKWSMTTEELEQIRKIVREEIQAETEPIKKDMATKADIEEVSEDMAGFFHKT